MRPWTAANAPPRGARGIASMGPRPCGRGRAVGDPTLIARYSRFNGATALRPWTVGDEVRYALGGTRFNGATALRPWTDSIDDGYTVPSHSFNGATALRPWTGAPPAQRSRTGKCFNGATALRPWTAWRRRCRHDGNGPASMGPRPCGRGRSSSRRPAAQSCPASMGPRPCGRGREKRVMDSIMPEICFNGATALRPWTGGKW